MQGQNSDLVNKIIILLVNYLYIEGDIQEVYMTTSVRHPKQFEFTTATDLLSLYSRYATNVILHKYKRLVWWKCYTWPWKLTLQSRTLNIERYLPQTKTKNAFLLTFLRQIYLKQLHIWRKEKMYVCLRERNKNPR